MQENSHLQHKEPLNILFGAEVHKLAVNQHWFQIKDPMLGILRQNKDSATANVLMMFLLNRIILHWQIEFTKDREGLIKWMHAWWINLCDRTMVLRNFVLEELFLVGYIHDVHPFWRHERYEDRLVTCSFWNVLACWVPTIFSKETTGKTSHLNRLPNFKNFLGAFGRKRSKHKNLSHSIVRTPRPEMRMDSVLKISICGNITWFNLIWSNTNQKTSWGNQKTSNNLDLLCKFVGILVYDSFQIAKGNASSLFVSAMLFASFTWNWNREKRWLVSMRTLE